MIVGRFAPSPTGALHRGSLVAAVASYCDASSQAGHWFVRIDDIDPPREEAGASERIVQTLHDFGFPVDRIDFQSTRLPNYKNALQALNEKALLYACHCTRKQMAGSPTCNGSCSGGTPARFDNDALDSAFKDVASIRFRASAPPVWRDAIQSNVIDTSQYDPIIWRKDGLVSYALACALDDSSGVSSVVRGSDLMDTTALQIMLMQALERPVPSYAHVPIMVNSKQQKLSKQTAAEPIDASNALPALLHTWEFLGQSPIDAHSLEDFWGKAVDQWSLSAVPKQRIIGHG